MTYAILNPSAEQKRAWTHRSWDWACETNAHFKHVFPQGDPRNLRLRNRVTFSDQSIAMLGSLNDFDLRKVLEEVVELTNNAQPAEAVSHWRNPFHRFLKSRYPFPSYHYLIRYEAEPNGKIFVHEVMFDENLMTYQEPYRNERNALYHVARGNGAKYTGPLERVGTEFLKGAWDVVAPTPQIKTDYAAVNGMLNNLEKAGWLMGVHLDNAYRNANPNEYTLFHNPTEKWYVDLVECIWDKKPGRYTHNAAHLSAILRQRQASGQSTEWVVHSQGAIIFHAAVNHHYTHYQTPLDKHSVVIHGSGANLVAMRQGLQRAQVKIVSVRNNPFDGVPNVAGANNLSRSGLWRALRFGGLILSENGGHGAVSPHTLPYLGIHTYQRQLEIAGYHKKAESVGRYIQKRNQDRVLRRARVE